MFVKLPFTRFATPAFLSMAAATASLLAWLVPSFGVLRKGFDRSESIDVTSFVVLTSWYALVFLSFFLGQELAGVVAKSARFKIHYPPFDSNTVYLTFTALTAVGTFSMVWKILHVLSPQLALLYLTVGQANVLGEALHDNYSFGLVSLRYLVVYSASVSLFRVVRRKKITFIAGLNFLMLLLIMTARLVLIATILMTIFQLNFDKKMVRLNILRMVAIAVVLFSLLSVVNYSRNAMYYSARGSSFFGAGISEIVAYLGAPVQVEVGMSKVLDELVNVDTFAYRPYVDIEEALNANSAFVSLHEQMGFASWLYIAAICGFMGFAFSLMCSFGKTSFLLPCGAILYGSSELWRVDLFQQGIFITWFVVGIGVPLSIMILSKMRLVIARACPRDCPSGRLRLPIQPDPYSN